jgi:hypothetical protein
VIKNLEVETTRDYYFDEQQRLYHDTTTWLAEVLDGHMRTPFEYTFDGRELYAQDGSSMRGVFEDAKRDAVESARWQPELSFELRRRKIELEEYYEMVAMMRDELPNTMVVVSDFPPELMFATHDVGGYNTTRKQTMLRVLHKTTDGRLQMYSQTLDRSHRQGLESIYQSLGFSPKTGELLGQRMHLNIEDESAEFLVDKLVGEYDRALSEQLGGSWYAGRLKESQQNTYDFVLSQSAILDVFMKQAESVSDREGLLRDLAAAMSKLYSSSQSSDVHNEASLPTIVNHHEAKLYMNRAGREADQAGKVFSGCGLTIGVRMAVQNSAEEQLKQNGYGNKVCIEVKNGQRVKCPDCKKVVKAIVPNKESIFCSNPSCKLAHHKVKQKKPSVTRKKSGPKHT